MWMQQDNNAENALREIAGRYAEQYGEELLRELAQREVPDADPLATQRLEWRVKQKIASEKRKPYKRVAVALAACFALLLVTPQLFRLSNEAPVSAAPAASESADAPSSSFEIIPLSAQLPEGFTQIGFEQDNEKSVYYLSDQFQDDVVVTLEASITPPETTGLTPLSLGETEAYGAQEDGYSLLTFQNDGVLYTLTCRHDINTLLRLGRGLV
jgi:hypothetical protein